MLVEEACELVLKINGVSEDDMKKSGDDDDAHWRNKQNCYVATDAERNS